MKFMQRQTLMLIAMIVLGLAFAVSVYSNAQSQTATRGPYMIAGGDKMMVWRIDQSTGAMSYCMRDSVSTDPKFIVTRPPYCSAWGN